MFCNLIAAALSGLLFGLAAPAPAPPPEGPDTTVAHRALKPTGRPGLFIFDDFNGDGIKDILLCGNRVLSLFESGPAGPGGTPSHVLRVPDDAVLLDVADIDGDGAREVVVLKAGGVYTILPGSQGMTVQTQIISAKSRLIPPRVEELKFVDFVRDISGDGPEDVIFPDLQVMEVFRSDGTGAFTSWATIPYTPRAEYSQEPLSDTGGRRETLNLPVLLAGGEVGVKRRFVLFDGSWIRLMQRQPDGSCKELAARNIYADETIADGDRDMRLRFSSNVFFEDLDHDGLGDLVVCNNSKGEMRFFLGIDEGHEDREDLCIKVQGNTFQPVLTDLNGDGRKDLILPSIGEVGLFTILKIFFTSRFSMSFMVFFNRGEPLFRMMPDDERRVTFPLSFSTTPKGISVASVLIYSFDGDFNGDSRTDLLLRGDKNRISVFYGFEGQAFATEPSLSFEVAIVPASFLVTTHTGDVTGDGRADLFLHQRSEKEERWDLYMVK